LLITGFGFGQRGVARSVQGELAQVGSRKTKLVDLDAVLGRTTTYRVVSGQSGLRDHERQRIEEVLSGAVVVVACDPGAARILAALTITDSSPTDSRSHDSTIGDSATAGLAAPGPSVRRTAAIVTSLAWDRYPLFRQGGVGANRQVKANPSDAGTIHSDAGTIHSDSDSAFDLYLATDMLQAMDMAEAGISADRIVPIGAATCGGFALAASLDRAESRQSCGLDPSVSALLLVTEGLRPDEAVGMVGLMDALFVEAENPSKHPPFQLLIDTALDLDTNLALERALETRSWPHVLFGKTDMAHLLWASADALLCTPLDHLVMRGLGLAQIVVTLPSHSELETRIGHEVARRSGLAVGDLHDLASTLLHAFDRLDRLAALAAAHRSTKAATYMAMALARLAALSPDQW